MKIVFALIISLLLFLPAYSGQHDKRIEELQKEHASLVQESNQYNQFIRNINIRLAQIVGAVEELKSLDGKGKKKTKKKKDKK